MSDQEIAQSPVEPKSEYAAVESSVEQVPVSETTVCFIDPNDQVAQARMLRNHMSTQLSDQASSAESEPPAVYNTADDRATQVTATQEFFREQESHMIPVDASCLTTEPKSEDAAVEDSTEPASAEPVPENAATGEQTDSMSPDSTVPDTPASSDSVLINGADLAPVGGEPESALDDDPLSELSQRFVDSLGLPMSNPELVRTNAQSGSDSAELPTEPSAEEIKKFNESMVMISAYAEDVVKTWFTQIYGRPMDDVFPDGLTGSIGSVTMLPSADMIRARRRARVGHDEEVRDDDMHEDDSAGWELRLAVVDSDHRVNLDEWKLKDPVVLQNMQGLLKMAWGYIQYAIESYDLPDKELFVNKVYPSPWGTLYVHGAPDTVPQIGVTLTRIHAKPKSKSE